MIKIIAILTLFAICLHAQKQDPPSYIVENYAFTDESKDTVSWFRYTLNITKIKESKKQIKINLSIRNLEHTAHKINEFLNEIEDHSLEINFNKTTGYITITDFKDLSEIGQYYGTRLLIGNTCFFEDSEVFIQNQVNANFFYLSILLNKHNLGEKIFVYSMEGTALKYRLNRNVTLNSLNANYLLEESSHEDYCYNIFDCLTSLRQDNFKAQLSLASDKYQKSEPEFKRKLSRRDYLSAERAYLNRHLKSTIAQIEKSYDYCLYEQGNLIYNVKIKNLNQRSEKIFIKRDNINFPVHWKAENMNIIRTVNNSKAD